MTLEALAPVTYRWPGGQIEFTPGVPVNVPDERGQRILTKANGKIRTVEPQSHQRVLALGDWVTWQDANGRCGTGAVAMSIASTDDYIVVYESGDVNDIVAVHKELVI